MTLALLEPLLFLAAALAASAGLLILQFGLQRLFAVAPRLKPAPVQPAPDTSLTVVIPAFNEAHNIAACVCSVLASASCRDWSVLVVDDDLLMRRLKTRLALAQQRPNSADPGGSQARQRTLGGQELGLQQGR